MLRVTLCLFWVSLLLKTNTFLRGAIACSLPPHINYFVSWVYLCWHVSLKALILGFAIEQQVAMNAQPITNIVKNYDI